MPAGSARPSSGRPALPRCRRRLVPVWSASDGSVPLPAKAANAEIQACLSSPPTGDIGQARQVFEQSLPACNLHRIRRLAIKPPNAMTGHTHHLQIHDLINNIERDVQEFGAANEDIAFQTTLLSLRSEERRVGKECKCPRWDQHTFKYNCKLLVI